MRNDFARQTAMIQCVPSEGGQVTIKGTEEEGGDLLTFSLARPNPGVGLVGLRMFQVVEVMEIERSHKFLKTCKLLSQKGHL